MDSTEKKSINTQVTAKIGEVNYLTTILANGKVLLGDEPEPLGGGNKGFNPYELIASSLGMCSAATLKMYADRKDIDLGEIQVRVELQHFSAEKSAVFRKFVSFENKQIVENDLKRLKAIAEACPINKLLSNEILIETVFS